MRKSFQNETKTQSTKGKLIRVACASNLLHLANSPIKQCDEYLEALQLIGDFDSLEAKLS